MKIFGLNLGKNQEKIITDNEALSLLSEIRQKSSGTFDKLWVHAKTLSEFSEYVASPYKSISSVYKSIKAICDNVSQARPCFFDKVSGEEIIEGSEVQELINLFNKPNPSQSWNDFVQEWVGFYSLCGEGFIWKLDSIGSRAGLSKMPVGLQAINPKHMQEKLDSNTRQIIGWRWTQGIEFNLDQIIFTKDFNPYNAYRGLSPIEAIADEIAIDQKSLEYNLNFFLNDATPSMILSTDKSISTEQKSRLESWWKSKHKGAKNSFNMEVLEGGMKATSIAQSHKDMDFIEQKRFTREEILGIWKAPKALFNITDDLNYATFQGQMKIFWVYTLIPIMKKFEDSINTQLIQGINPNIIFKFDIKNVPAFQEDFNGKVTTAKTLWDMGFTGNEINEKLDLGFEQEEWRDEWWVNGLMMPASQVGNMSNEETPAPEETIDDDSIKGFKSSRTIKQLLLLKAFKNVHIQLQLKMDAKLRKLFYGLRKQVLSISTEELGKGNINIDWVKTNKELQDIARPLIEAGIHAGVDIGKRYVGKGIADDILNSKLASYLSLRVDQIVNINKTTEKKIKETVQRAIAEGQGSGQTAVDILGLGEAVREDLKGLFNTLSSRARTIAVTEMATAVNGGSFIYYNEVGVKTKSWLTAHDEEVRESHRECESQGEIPMNSKFGNGCAYPSDQDGEAGEIINCRCVLQPTVE